jgi:hypothetical protein
MALFKSKPEITQETVDKAAIPAGRWRFVTDAEHADAVAALAEIVGKKTAAMPSWQRRLGVRTDGTEGFALAIEIPLIGIRGERYFGSAIPPKFSTVAYALSVGVAILQSSLNPEIELADRRAQHAEFLAEQDRKRAAEAEALRKHHADRAAAEQERATCRAGDWGLLARLERFATRLALAVESRDPALAADLRSIVAQSLTEEGDGPETWPKTPAWFAGLGLETLSPDRRQDLQNGAADERMDAILRTVPPDKLPSLKLLHGSEKSALVRGWLALRHAILRERDRDGRAASAKAAAEPGEREAAKVRARVQAERAAQDAKLRRAEL